MERNTPLVTVGLPMYNPGRFLDLAVRSVFAQTYDNWELIILDDGSTDGSLELARRIRDPRVNVFSDGKNRGLPYRLNQILDLASGQFIARMDADDLMHPERIERQGKHLLAYPEADAVTTGAILIDREIFSVLPSLISDKDKFLSLKISATSKLPLETASNLTFV